MTTRAAETGLGQAQRTRSTVGKRLRTLLKLVARNIDHPILIDFCGLILIGMLRYPVTTAALLSMAALAVELGFIGWAVRISGPEKPVAAPLGNSPQRQCDW